MKYFGTDGIRDRVDGPLLAHAFVRRLGRAAGTFFAQTSAGETTVVIGRDTRDSGEQLMQALCAGLRSIGVKVLDAGMVPTPAVACVVPHLHAVAGIAITASHNPAHDNGIKFFNASGTKLTDEEEAALEQQLEREQDPGNSSEPVPTVDAQTIYLNRLRALLPANALQGWKIALDCAHGATWQTTPTLLRGLGAEIVSSGCEPDGTNINANCGSEHPEQLQQLVLNSGARMGIGHDGDGDRVILIDETGAVVDGDELLAMIGLDLLQRGELAGGAVVATVMSNLGLDAAMQAAGGTVVRAGVGDRQVLQAMAEHGYVFGGEASGHIVLKQHLPTGDGLLAALAALQILLRTGQPLSRARRVMSLFPQLKKNLKVRNKLDLDQIPSWQSEYLRMETELGKGGRMLVRYSGTEPKIRLLVEAADGTLASTFMNRLEQLVRTHLEVTG